MFFVGFKITCRVEELVMYFLKSRFVWVVVISLKTELIGMFCWGKHRWNMSFASWEAVDFMWVCAEVAQLCITVKLFCCFQNCYFYYIVLLPLLYELWHFCLSTGAAGCVATLLHDAIMNPAEGTVFTYKVANLAHELKWMCMFMSTHFVWVMCKSNHRFSWMDYRDIVTSPPC
jgi:hypothetical protein